MIRYWTPEEDNVLRERYPKEGTSASLQKDLGWKKQSIRCRARRLGLTLAASNKWSLADDSIIREYYHQARIEAILPRLSQARTEEAVRVRAMKLGLGDHNRWCELEDNILRKHYVLGEWDKIYELLPHRTKMGLKKRAKNLHLRVPHEVITRIRQEGHSRRGHKVYPSYGKINGSVILSALHGADMRDIPCPLLDGRPENMQYLDSIAHDFCALSGLPIVYSVKYRQPGATASLDRIDSNLGYVKGNVQWVHKRINRMKSDLRPDEFVHFCKAVAQHNGEGL